MEDKEKQKIDNKVALETAMQQQKLQEAYTELDKFILNMVINKKLTLLPIYFDDAMEGRRTYRGDFRFFPSTDKDIESAPEALKKLNPSDEKKLEIM